MDRRKKILAAVLLVAAGVAAGWVFAPWVGWFLRTSVPRTAAAWDEQVRTDALSIVRDVFEKDVPLDALEKPEFRTAWDAQRSFYTPERLVDLRRRLGVYLDFLVAESADCAEIYRVGRVGGAGQRSEGAEDARRALRTAYGDYASTLEEKYDAQREEAFRASPKTAGFSEDLPDYRLAHDDLMRWLPEARAVVERLTEPPK